MQITLLILLCACSLLDAQKTVPASSRIDCHPAPNPTKENCAPGCIWDSDTYLNDPTIPLCYVPQHMGYDVTGPITEEKNYMALDLISSPDSVNPYGENISPITFECMHDDASLGIRIGTGGRYRPILTLPRAGIPNGEQFTVTITKKLPFTFTVKRQSTNATIWDTSIGGFMFADQYIQIATYLPTEYIYGFGESVHLTLKHNFSNYTTQGMFARDAMPDTTKIWQNLYGVHPFYLGLEPDGKAHGVLILNSDPMEITTGPAPHLIYRTIGGMLEIHFFFGPTPEQVIQQYQQFIGLPMLPAYWSFGFQLCRYGYTSLTELENTVSRNLNAGVPIEVVYTDIDYMERYVDFTIASENWGGLPDYVNRLHANNMRYVPIIDVGIPVDSLPFDRAVYQDASFIDWESLADIPAINQNYTGSKNTVLMLGPVWPDQECAFPDFIDSTQTTGSWWISEIVEFHHQLAFDGIWIDMNEPAVLATNTENPYYWNDPANPTRPHIPALNCPINGSNHYETPPYQTWNAYAYNVYNGENDATLSSKTICLSGMANRGQNRVYDTKNLFGLYETIYTQQAVHKATGKRGFVLSRSTFPSSGHYGGHWLGDNFALFASLQTSIIGIQEFNMFGIPYVGADICGFNDNTTEELCLRWQQLGAFYPFMRNHNNILCRAQDPAQWPNVAAASRQAIFFRYYYLPYLYSLHFDVALNGGTVVRPVFFEFTNDRTARAIDHQFLWGSSMMIIPVVNEGQNYMTAYIPEGLWYSLRDSDYGKIVSNGEVTLRVPTTDLIPVVVRGGSIIPRQRGEMTLADARKNPFELLIALDSNSPDVTANASGQLYWDDGESIISDFATYPYYHWKFFFVSTSTEAMLYINPLRIYFGLSIPTLDVIDVIGYPYCANLDLALINGQSKSLGSSTKLINNRLLINATNLIDISSGKSIVMIWPHGKDCPKGSGQARAYSILIFYLLSFYFLISI